MLEAFTPVIKVAETPSHFIIVISMNIRLMNNVVEIVHAQVEHLWLLACILHIYQLGCLF